MSEEFEGINDIKNLFIQILGSEVTIKDNIDASEEGVFCLFVQKLESAYEMENKVFEAGGIELGKVTDPLWFVIENSFKFLYGEEATQLVYWYIFDRFNPDGTVVPLEDENGKQFTFSSPKELWKYINYRFPSTPNE